MEPFQNREDAGKQLAQKLLPFKNTKNTIVIAIPRGGLVIGAELAAALNLPLDVCFTKKIGHPHNPEYAIGVVSLEETYIEEEVSQEYLDQEISRIRGSLKEKKERYSQGLPPFDVAGKTIIITDDGVATGKTLLLTIRLIRKMGAKKIIIAIPVGPREALSLFQKEADETIFLTTPPNFFAISEFYKDFGQIEDSEAIQLLRKYHGNTPR